MPHSSLLSRSPGREPGQPQRLSVMLRDILSALYSMHTLHSRPEHVVELKLLSRDEFLPYFSCAKIAHVDFMLPPLLYYSLLANIDIRLNRILDQWIVCLP
jgi:hypothetical protein